MSNPNTFVVNCDKCRKKQKNIFCEDEIEIDGKYYFVCEECYNKLYYNGKEVLCEIVSGNYKNGSYFLTIRPYTNLLYKLRYIHEPKLFFRGDRVVLKNYEVDFDNIDLDIELYILPKKVVL